MTAPKHSWSRSPNWPVKSISLISLWNIARLSFPPPSILTSDACSFKIKNTTRTPRNIGNVFQPNSTETVRQPSPSATQHNNLCIRVNHHAHHHAQTAPKTHGSVSLHSRSVGGRSLARGNEFERRGRRLALICTVDRRGQSRRGCH